MKLETDTLFRREREILPTHDIKIFSGRSNGKLTQEIAEYLGTHVAPLVIKNFSDGEVYVQIEESVRGDDVFIVQPICKPVNENLVELLIIIDAFKRASAKSTLAIIFLSIACDIIKLLSLESSGIEGKSSPLRAIIL